MGLKWHLFVHLELRFSVFFFNSCLLIIIWPLSSFNRPKHLSAKLYSIYKRIMPLPESCEKPYQDPCEMQRRLSLKKFLYEYMAYMVIIAHWANRVCIQFFPVAGSLIHQTEGSAQDLGILLSILPRLLLKEAIPYSTVPLLRNFTCVKKSSFAVT